MVGLPGTGLGGIFYILLVAWLVLRQCWISIKGGGERRWPEVRRLVTLCALIISILWVEALCITLAFGDLPRFRDMISSSGTASGVATVLIVVTPFAILGLLLTGLHTARLLLRS